MKSKINKIFLAVLMLCFSTATFAFTKQQLRVLYVGGSPEFETVGLPKKPAQKDIEKSAKARTAAFAKFLKTYFTTVKAIDAKDYTAALSDDYDVTIFDGTPKALKEAKMVRDADGRVIDYQRAAYLPMDFNRAALCIADASEIIGRSVGTKEDWYCLCLSDRAHSWVKDHPIFKGPFKVDLKPSMQTTPADAKMHASWEDKVLPEKTEMWQVQTTNYEKDPTKRIGMVARPFGYFDSPDVEYISSGVCAKTIDAVAIGRHANFFHWGFSASPRDLTPAGKTVLANAIVYIAKFNGQHPIARKLDENILTRDVIRREGYYVHSQRGYRERVESNREFYDTIDSIGAVIRAKRAKKQKLTLQEQSYEDMIDTPRPKEQTIDEYFAGRDPELYKIFGTDDVAWKEYFDRNMKWFRPSDDKAWNPEIDTDIRSIGYSNSDIRLLDSCVTMLEQGRDADKAMRVLRRYTLCRYDNASDWRHWLDTYRDKLFFTETGGWLWLVNSMDPNVPGNDYTVYIQEHEAAMKAKAEKAKKTTDAQPAAATALRPLTTDFKNPVDLDVVTRQADGGKQIVVRQKVEQGFHTYAICGENDPFIITEVTIDLPKGWKKVGNLKRPAASPLGNTGTTIYEGEGEFLQAISGSGEGTATVTVSYQVCNATMCMQPVTKTFTVTL